MAPPPPSSPSSQTNDPSCLLNLFRPSLFLVVDVVGSFGLLRTEEAKRKGEQRFFATSCPERGISSKMRSNLGACSTKRGLMLYFLRKGCLANVPASIFSCAASPPSSSSSSLRIRMARLLLPAIKQKKFYFKKPPPPFPGAVCPRLGNGGYKRAFFCPHSLPLPPLCSV